MQQDTSAPNDSEEEYCYMACDSNEQTVYMLSLPTATVKVNNDEVKLLLDTDSTVNTLHQHTYASVGSPPMKHHKQPKVHAYGEADLIHILGQCQLPVEMTSQIQCHTFLIPNLLYIQNS